MIRGLWTAASGMVAQQMQTDVVANNLANTNTTGFKKSRANFQDVMYQTMLVAGAITPGGGQIPSGIQVGMGVRPASVQKIFTEGDFVQTGNDLDFAIEGRGFFQVLHNGEPLYTKAGNFTKDSEGFITTPAGDRLQPEIALPPETILVTLQSNGLLTAHGPGEEILLTEQITLHNFVNPSGLFAMGQNLFRPTEGSGDPIEGIPGEDGLGTVSNHYLEMSNVSVVEEMVAMIVGQRAYEANSKSVQTADTMLGLANGLKR
ncbi:flagellar basal-body rod protein FlgG [Desulfobotulus sp.]|jgi:flagellar basal-body rod protein FlgG|uniref:flagellar basal-body rod protein FlgG n=1 Tax=Desulfobotulus sp. TaxID=1940337 RepID=UPI002A365629|nr:flagellar basal-body rod protein FlgG [Desulfobotulus sp.]MDY0164729.1 flagellar basal-body rod protein FlgG [Desulfobotulus sp.]